MAAEFTDVSCRCFNNGIDIRTELRIGLFLSDQSYPSRNSGTARYGIPLQYRDRIKGSTLTRITSTPPKPFELVSLSEKA